MLIEKIELYPEKRADGRILRSITFHFPVYYGDESMDVRKEEQHIRYVLDCSKIDTTSAEAKATYAAIKAYVTENYGVKVSSLYIAQVKRKYGFNMAVNYNLSDDPEHKVPKCPKEKERIIFDTLKHFKMIDKDTEFIDEERV